MKNVKNLLLKFIVLVLVCTAAAACKKDGNDPAKPVNPNETELVTSVKLFVSAGASRSQEYAYTDLDGDGGNAPTIDTIRLLPNIQYLAYIVVLDETKNPVDTISIEINEEKNAHQFFYSKIGTYDITTTYHDFDDHNVPVGLSFRLDTHAGFTEKTNKFKIVLKHQPGLKPLTGNGDASLGETDLEVDFPILIQ